jgi:hypothetical protein
LKKQTLKNQNQLSPLLGTAKKDSGTNIINLKGKKCTFTFLIWLGKVNLSSIKLFISCIEFNITFFWSSEARRQRVGETNLRIILVSEMSNH